MDDQQKALNTKAIGVVDVGYGLVKAMVSKRPMSQNIDLRSTCFPRLIAPGPGKKWSSLRTAPIYSIGDEKYVLGNDARAYRQHLLSDQAKDYIKKPTYWLMVGKAFHDMGAYNGTGLSENNELILKKAVLGLAPGHHTDDIEKIMIEKMIQGFSFKVQDSENVKEFFIRAEDVHLLPQGAGPYFEHFIDENGKPVKQEILNGNNKLLYGILDIGHETVDYVVVDNTQYITPKETPSEPNGIRYVLENLLEHVREQHDYTGERAEMLIDTLCGQPFFWKGEFIDLSATVKELVKTHIRKNIEPNIIQRWQEFMGQMQHIFICGGGAWLIRKYFPDFLSAYRRQLIFCAQPQMSNVVGFHRFALLKDLKETKGNLSWSLK